MTNVWRMYANGDVKDETHVLYPHFADGQKCTGYDGNVDAWAKHNRQWRPGCAQIVQEEGSVAKVIYPGGVSASLLEAFVSTRRRAENVDS